MIVVLLPAGVAWIAVIALRNSRLRTGGTSWRLYRDGADPTGFVEQYTVASWDEHHPGSAGVCGSRVARDPPPRTPGESPPAGGVSAVGLPGQHAPQ